VDDADEASGEPQAGLRSMPHSRGASANEPIPAMHDRHRHDIQGPQGPGRWEHEVRRVQPSKQERLERREQEDKQSGGAEAIQHTDTGDQ
jgi:hypothetical protein